MPGDQVTGAGTSAGGDAADGLADLVRTAFLASIRASSPARSAARDQLWLRLAPQVDRMAMRVCRGSHPALRCPGPSRCHHLWCAQASEYLMTELLNPERPRSLAVRITAKPDASDDDITKWVGALRTNLWTETRRALLRDAGLHQRVDVWISESPHRACLQDLLEEELADDLDLLATFGPVTIEAWGEALAVDAVQWATGFPDCDRVLRHLGHDETERQHDRIPETDLARAHLAVRRVDRAFTTYDEAACVRCGGQPKLDGQARMNAAQAMLTTLDEADVKEMVNAGNAVITPDGTVQVVGPHRAGRILLFAAPPRSATTTDDQRRLPWYTRFVLEPRTRFLEGRPAGVMVERIVDQGPDDESEGQVDG